KYPGAETLLGMPRVPSRAAEHIGQLMLEQRRMRGMTQDEVAAVSGIDSSNIRAYERGRSMPNVQSLVRVADALDVHPGVLLEGLTPAIFREPRSADAATPRRAS
ncbi:MAG: helix-turn-helix domain-containing protein, partial [Microbacteriaceae bacterium]